MNEVDTKRPGQIILGWWSQNIGAREAALGGAPAAGGAGGGAE